MYESILLLTDGGTGARRAASAVDRLARVTGATVHVLAVDDPRSASRESGGTGTDETATALSDAVRTVRAVEEGRPFRVAVEYVDDHGVDLVVMGTRSEGIQEPVLGGTTGRILQTAQVPVLTVPPGCDPESLQEFEDVLIATDGSARATRATNYGLQLAATFGSTVHGVFVVDLPTLTTFTTRSVRLSAGRELADEGREALDVFAAAAANAVEGTDHRTSLRWGDPAAEIREYATENDVDLVVLGAHGHTTYDRLSIGSVAESVTRTSPCPVLVVPTVDRAPGHDPDRWRELTHAIKPID